MALESNYIRVNGCNIVGLRVVTGWRARLPTGTSLIRTPAAHKKFVSRSCLAGTEFDQCYVRWV